MWYPIMCTCAYVQECCQQSLGIGILWRSLGSGDALSLISEFRFLIFKTRNRVITWCHCYLSLLCCVDTPGSCFPTKGGHHLHFQSSWLSRVYSALSWIQRPTLRKNMLQDSTAMPASPILCCKTWQLKEIFLSMQLHCPLEQHKPMYHVVFSSYRQKPTHNESFLVIDVSYKCVQFLLLLLFPMHLVITGLKLVQASIIRK